MSKRVVHYYKDSVLNKIVVGQGAFVIPVDHSDSKHVSNKKHVYTSDVIKVTHSTGVFETQNSEYVPLEVIN